MRIPLFWRRILWLLLLPVAWADVSGAAQAADLGRADAKAIRRVIEAQFDAFAKDDASKAFSYAAPPIKALFGDAQRFMHMVKTGYPAVIRPTSVVFLKPESADGDIFQAVQLSDADGQVWLAHYRMQRQKNRAWLINGCQLERGAGRIT